VAAFKSQNFIEARRLFERGVEYGKRAGDTRFARWNWGMMHISYGKMYFLQSIKSSVLGLSSEMFGGPANMEKLREEQAFLEKALTAFTTASKVSEVDAAEDIADVRKALKQVKERIAEALVKAAADVASKKREDDCKQRGGELVDDDESGDEQACRLTTTEAQCSDLDGKFQPDPDAESGSCIVTGAIKGRYVPHY